LLGYKCSKKVYDVQGRDEPMTVHMEGCELEDFLRSLHNGFAITGPVLFVSSVALWLLLQIGFRRNRGIQMQIMWFAKPMLPRLFYNGMGPAQSDHSAWHIFKKYGLEKHWSWLHDSMGSLDLVVSALALMFTIAIGFVVMGYYTDGIAGATKGAAAGTAVGRLMLLVLNYALGASYCFISYVDEQLHGFQPYKKVMNHETGIREEYVQSKVKHAAEVIRSAGMKTKERTRWDGKGLEELVQRIEEEGPKLLQTMVDWLLEHQDSLFCVQNSCWHLFHTNDTYSSDQYSIACLSMMDIPNLLATYCDPEWSILGRFTKFNGERWTPSFKLSTVYMGYPHQLLSKRMKNGLWKVAEINSEEALEDLSELDGIGQMEGKEAEV